MIEQFTTHQEFLAYVDEEWESGNLNELESDEFIKIEKKTVEPETGKLLGKTYRPLTASEFALAQAVRAKRASREPNAAQLARYERRALALVNRLRRSAGLKTPAARLEVGARRKPSICPLANSLLDWSEDFKGDVEPETNFIRLEVDNNGLYVFCNDTLVENFPLNRDCRRFVKFFDAGFYPHLIDTFSDADASGEEIEF